MALSACLLETANAQSLRPGLDHATAVNISEHCQQKARKTGYNVAISVYDQNGILVVFDRMDGASVGAVETSFWKGRSAATWGFSTADTTDWPQTLPYIATVEGGTSIFTKDGQLIGGVGVSGAPAEFDGKCGRDAIKAVGLNITRTN